MNTQYKTILKEARGEFKDRGSKFLAYAYPFKSQKQLKIVLSTIQKKHPKARHHCFAYRCGTDGDQFRSYDDNEPSGTAGKPILRAIDKFNLTMVLIVVVRYFGGTKLGTSGLIQAYHNSAVEAIRSASIIEKQVMAYYEIKVNYELSAMLIQVLNQMPCKILKMDFVDHASIFVNMTVNYAPKFELAIKAKLGGLYYNEVTALTQIDGLELKQLYIK